MKIVGIGASAGGLKAMSSLLAKLPNDSGACFVFLQHLSPDSKTITGELLAKHTDMPVKVVYEDQPVMANHVYVMAENKNLQFSHDMLITKDRVPSERINLPIDQFFHSLAEQVEAEAIGVLLSGTGTDGTRGLRVIKEKGGIVLVQSPETAQFDGMPKAAINLKIADSIAPPDKLSGIIMDLLTGEAGAVQLEQPNEKEASTHFNRIITLISSKTGIDFSYYRLPTLARRINNRLLLNKCKGLPEYLALLKASPDELRILSQDVLIGVTRFFRDPEAFEELRSNILPDIFSREHLPNKPYRFWIPACSTGEEAYSIAMLIDQYIQDENLEVDYKIFASDVDEEAIRFAIKGLYSSSMVTDTPKDLIANYFIQEGGHFRVRASLRKRMLFAVQNLLGDPPFIDMDLISCRNFLIYLKPEAQQKVLSTLHFALREEGRLFLGPSESLGALRYAFKQITRRWNFFEKHPDARLRYSRSNFSTNQSSLGIRAVPKKTSASMNYEDHETDPFTQYLVERYAPISLFVNSNLDLLYINGDAESLLKIPRALARLNLHKMMGQNELSKIQTGVEQVLEKRKPQTYTDIKLSKGDKNFNARLRFDLPNIPDFQEPEEEVILIEIHLSRKKANDVDSLSESDFKSAKSASLQRELSEEKRRSQELVDKLESANEELQTSNRELMASNEELQSTNQELQSVNEELYTVNRELQLKNEELSLAHNDINNLLKSTEIGTIFLDKDLHIRKFTPAVRRQFNLLEADIGRAITSFSSTFEELDIKKECEKVFDTLKTFEREVIDNKGDHYLIRILPYRTEEDRIEGLVITFIDIGDMVSTQERMDQLAKKYKAIFNFSYSVIAVIDAMGEVESMNRPLGPYHPDDIVGKVIFDVLPEHLSNELRVALKASTKAQTPQRLNIQIAPDEWFAISLIPNPYQPGNGEGNEIPVIMMAEEATEGKERTNQLEQSLEKYKAFMDNAAQQIALVDEEGAIQYINQAQGTGKSKAELKGTSILEYAPSEQKKTLEEAIKNIFQGTLTERLLYTFDDEAGQPVEAGLIATPVIIGGKVEYVAIVWNKQIKEQDE